MNKTHDDDDNFRNFFKNLTVATTSTTKESTTCTSLTDFYTYLNEPYPYNVTKTFLNQFIDSINNCSYDELIKIRLFSKDFINNIMIQYHQQDLKPIYSYFIIVLFIQLVTKVIQDQTLHSSWLPIKKKTR